MKAAVLAVAAIGKRMKNWRIEFHKVIPKLPRLNYHHHHAVIAIDQER